MPDFATLPAPVRALATGAIGPPGPRPLLFDKAQTIIKLKRSDSFAMRVERDTANSTPLAKGDIIANAGRRRGR